MAIPFTLRFGLAAVGAFATLAASKYAPESFQNIVNAVFQRIQPAIAASAERVNVSCGLFAEATKDVIQEILKVATTGAVTSYKSGSQ